MNVLSRGTQVRVACPHPSLPSASIVMLSVFVCLTLQYRVESMMLRLAKPANYIAVSPSIQQRARYRKL